MCVGFMMVVISDTLYPNAGLTGAIWSQLHRDNLKKTLFGELVALFLPLHTFSCVQFVRIASRLSRSTAQHHAAHHTQLSPQDC
jgi:hypothetical protein